MRIEISAALSADLGKGIRCGTINVFATALDTAYIAGASYDVF